MIYKIYTFQYESNINVLGISNVRQNKFDLIIWPAHNPLKKVASPPSFMHNPINSLLDLPTGSLVALQHITYRFCYIDYLYVYIVRQPMVGHSM